MSTGTGFTKTQMDPWVPLVFVLPRSRFEPRAFSSSMLSYYDLYLCRDLSLKGGSKLPLCY